MADCTSIFLMIVNSADVLKLINCKQIKAFLWCKDNKAEMDFPSGIL